MSAASAREGLDHIDDELPDVLVCALSLPELSGLQFTRVVRARSSARGGSSPALAVGDEPESQRHAVALLYGYQAYLTKAESDAKLVAVVRELAREGID